MEPEHSIVASLNFAGNGRVLVQSLETAARCVHTYTPRLFEGLKVGSHILLDRRKHANEERIQENDRFRALRVNPLIAGSLQYKGTICTMVNDRAAFVYCPRLDAEALLRPHALLDPLYSDGKRFLLPMEIMQDRVVFFKLKGDTMKIEKCEFKDPPSVPQTRSMWDEEEMQSSVKTFPPIGCWEVAGCIPTDLFNFPFEVRCIYQGAPEVPLVNTIPPHLYQKSELILDLVGVGRQHTVTLTVTLEEDGSDYTKEVCTVEGTTHVEEAIGITPVHRLVVSILPFSMEGEECELNLNVAINDRKKRVMKLTSKPFYVKREKVLARASSVSDSASFKYWSHDFLLPSDVVEFGFQDPGRSNEFQEGEGIYQDAIDRVREVITVDESDAALRTLRSEAMEVGMRIMEIKHRAVALGWFVSCRMGGPYLNEDKYEDHIKTLRGIGKKRPRSDENEDTNNTKVNNTVQLGSLYLGLCRHRALLYKYLADEMQIPTYLVRGFYLDESDGERHRHTWNVIVCEDGEVVYIDTMLQSIVVPPSKVASYLSATINSREPEEPPTQYLLLPRFDKLLVKEELGRGATAVVYRVTIGGMSCARKMAKNRKDRNFLKTEFHTLKALRQPDPTVATNIVQTLGWRSGLLLEYFPFSLLGFMNQLLFKKQMLGMDQIHQALQGAANALRECHDKGFVHRDVKAENVLLSVERCKPCAMVGGICPHCNVYTKLADFADAIQLPFGSDGEYSDAPTTSWGKFGTRPYSCPEFEAVAAFSQSADMWSLGILAVELANMQLPMTKSDAPGIMLENTYLDPPTPLYVPTHRHGDRAPLWLSKVIEGCLQIDRNKRISAVEVLALLGAPKKIVPKKGR